MWFIGVEVEQETSAPPPKKKILEPRLILFCNHYHMHAVQVIILQCIAAQLFDPAYHRLFLNHTCLEP